MRSLPLHNQRGCLVHDAVNDGSARSLAAAASIAAASSIVEACPPRSTEGWSRANPMCTPLLVCSTIPLAVREMRWTKPLPGGPRTARPADAGGGKAVRASGKKTPGGAGTQPHGTQPHGTQTQYAIRNVGQSLNTQYANAIRNMQCGVKAPIRNTQTQYAIRNAGQSTSSRQYAIRNTQYAIRAKVAPSGYAHTQYAIRNTQYCSKRVP